MAFIEPLSGTPGVVRGSGPWTTSWLPVEEAVTVGDLFKRENIAIALILIFGILTGVIAIIGVLANVGSFGEDVRKSSAAKWLLASIIGPIASVVILFVRSELVTKQPFMINIYFRENPSAYPPQYADVADIDEESTTFEIRLGDERVEGGRPDLAPEGSQDGQPVWRWRSPIPLSPEHRVKLVIVDKDKRRWTINTRPTMSFEVR